MINVPVTVGGITRFFWVRPNTTDLRSRTQIIDEQALETRNFPLEPELEARYAAIVESKRRPLIVDAGANVGASAVWYALTYPRARVAALEPDPGNFAVLVDNAANAPIFPIRAALVGDPMGRWSLRNPARGEWGYQVQRDAKSYEPDVNADDLHSVIGRFSDAEPFIFKSDIEGGEAELFAHTPPDLLNRFALLVVELHDWMIPGQGVSTSFYRAITAPGVSWDIVHRGEHTFCFNNRKDWGR